MIILIGGEVLKRKKAKQLKDVNYVITRFYDLLYTLKDLSLQSEQAYRKIVIILQMLGKVVILPYELHDFSVPYLGIIDPVYW